MDKNELIQEKIVWLNEEYGGDWFWSVETQMFEDFDSDMCFMLEDV